MPARSPGVLRALFSPSMVLLHVAGVLAVLAAGWLGQWQLGAWQEHRLDRTAELAEAKPVPLDRLMGPDDPFPADGVGRPVDMAGRWDPNASVFVSGRLHDGAAGFWMVTPLVTCGDTGRGLGGCARPSAVPVVVGWTPRVQKTPAAPSGTASVSGWLQPGDASGDAPDSDPGDDVLPSLQIGALVQRVKQDLYSGYVILDTPAEARAGLTAVTPESLPAPSTFTALRNFLYAVQWWVFGLFAAFLWWRWGRDELQRLTGTSERDRPADSPHEVAGPEITSEDATRPRIRSTS